MKPEKRRTQDQTSFFFFSLFIRHHDSPLHGKAPSTPQSGGGEFSREDAFIVNVCILRYCEKGKKGKTKE